MSGSGKAPTPGKRVRSSGSSAGYNTGPPNARRGMITRWNDERGFGLIESQSEEFFVHVTEVRGHGKRRPGIGHEVWFTAGVNAEGKPRASNVEYVWKETPGCAPLLRPLAPLLLLCAAPFLAGKILTGYLLVVPSWLLMASTWTCALYSLDKRRAITGGRRIPEITLHFMELLGGWPGGILSRRWIRHKSKKIPFRFVSAAIILLYQMAAMDVMLDFRLSRFVVAAWERLFPG